MKAKKISQHIKNLHFRYLDDEVPALGAELAYYLLLAFFPFLLFVMTVIGYSSLSEAEVLKNLSKVLPYDTYEFIDENISYILKSKNSGVLSFGAITTLWVASRGVGAVIRALNKAYDAQEERPFWKIKGIAILFTIILTLIIFFSFILLIFGDYVGHYIAAKFELDTFFRILWDILRYLSILALISAAFASIYRYMPNRRLSWKEVIPGSVITTVGWVLISLGFSFYVNHFANYTKIYGTIGGVIALLVWLYLNALTILMGGELNAVLAFDRVGKEKPKGKRY